MAARLGDPSAVTYTVAAGDTHFSIAQGVANAINSDSVLPFLLDAYTFSGDSRVFMRAISPSQTTYRATVSSGATETMGIGYNTNGVQTASLTGTITAGNVIGITVFDPALSGGQKTISYTIQSGDDAGVAIGNLANLMNADTSLQTLGFGAWWGANTMFLYSRSANATYYATSVNTGGTETFKLGPGTTCATAYAYNTVNELVSTAPGGQVPVQGTTNKPVKSASVSTPVVNISATQPNTDYGAYVTQFGTETLTLGQNHYGNTTATVSGTVTVGDVVQINVFNSALSGGEVKVPHLNVSGDTTTSIATALASTINSTSALTSLGMSATSSGAVVTISMTGTTYTTSTSGGATETLTLGPNNSGNISVTVGGKITAGNTITLTAHNAAFSGGTSSATYTILSTDTLATAAAGLANKINTTTAMTALGLAATSTFTASLPDTESYFANATVSAGTNGTTISAVDGGNNTKSNPYAIQATGGNAATLTYDLNGNMTSDGTNSYSWDAENRLIKITYPGTGNYTSFQYDPLGRDAGIVETASGSTTSTQQFVWSAGCRRELRDSIGNVVSSYFALGQKNSSNKYFYSADHLGSKRVMTDSSTNIVSQYSFDPFGNRISMSEVVPADFQYGGYFLHQRSTVYSTRTRFYSSSLGRWLNDDPTSGSGPNRYAYVSNAPSIWVDPIGTEAVGAAIGSGFGAITGGIIGGLAGEGNPIAIGAGAGEGAEAGGLIGSGLGDVITAAAGLGAIYAMNQSWGAEQVAEHQAYHDRCDRPVPSNLTDPCERSKWILQRNQDCYTMRLNFMIKWNDFTSGHMSQLAQVLRSIKNAIDSVKRDCRPKCKKKKKSGP